MLYAIAKPKPGEPGRGKKSFPKETFSASEISKARFVLREAPDLVGIRLLRALAELLAELPGGGGTVGQRFAGALASYETGAADGIRLDEIIGLAPAPGQVGWWTVERRAQRVAKLLEIDRAMFAGAPRPKRHARAERIAQALRRYASTTFPSERSLPVAPVQPLRRLMWQALKLGDAPAARTIDRWLAAAETVADRGPRRCALPRPIPDL